MEDDDKDEESNGSMEKNQYTKQDNNTTNAQSMASLG